MVAGHAMPPTITVAGLGSVLMSDDGVGPYVLRTLEAGWSFPAGVHLLDAGTPGLGFSSMLAGVDALVVIDAVNVQKTPGTVQVLSHQGLHLHQQAPRTTPHDPGLLDALLALEISGAGPAHVRLIGIQPASLEKGTKLTPAVQAAIPRAVAAVLQELEALGSPGRARSSPRPPDIWWEHAGGALPVTD